MMRALVGRHAVALAKYFVIGGVSALVEWSVFWLLLRPAAVNYLAAAVVAFLVATFVNYLLCVRTIFVSKTKSGWKDAAMVYVASLLGLVINVSTLAVLVSQFGIDPMPAKIVGTGSAFLFNFAARQFFIFGQRPDAVLRGAD